MHEWVYSIKLTFSTKLCYLYVAVYTLFALSEYIVVISNILFHGMAVFDFSEGKLKVVDSVRLVDKSS